MSRFDGARFQRVFANDLLQQWRKIWIATLGLAAIALVTYLTNVDPQAAVRPAIHLGLFPTFLLCGGLIFTSTIFTDLHHPLQRFHYLTLPCSNLERFLSRYLLSAPLFFVYVLVVYQLFDWIAGVVAVALTGTRAAPFSPLDPGVWELALQYLGVHAVMFLGAIYFRSYAFIKTALSAAVIGFGLVILQLVAFRLLFWGSFTSFFEMERSVPVHLFIVPSVVLAAGWILMIAWILYVAYECLREHEVQREL